MRTVRSGPGVALIAQVVLLAVLDTGVGLGGVGWAVGLVCAVAVNGAVAVALARGAAEVLGPADVVTLTRAMLACGVAALTADTFVGTPAVTALVALAAVALALDAVDGRVARRTRTESAFGARFDGEVDAFLILVLSVYVARTAGGWVLAIGAARYVFAVAGWVLPWMRRQLPSRNWRRPVAATQGIVLTVAAAGLVIRPVVDAALLVALVLLAESFGRDVGWLWRHRRAGVPGTAEPADTLAGEPARARGRRNALTAVVNLAALLLVWFALDAPNRADHLTPGVFMRIPVEGLVLAALALVLPSLPRRVMAAVVGVPLGLLTVVKILDMGAFAILDRPFNLVTDRGYLGPAVEFAADAVGPVGATVAVVAVVVLVLAVLLCTPLAVGRLTGLVARNHRWSIRIIAALVAVWVASAVGGLRVGPEQPVASASSSRLAVGKVRTTTADAQELQKFDAAASLDHFRRGADMLAGLRGKDVLVVFIESYGRSAIETTPSSPRVRAALDAATQRLRASGYSSRSAFLTSPTFGALSWLAHSTLQSGLWVNDQLRYDRLLESNRLTLTRAFGRAGWRTVSFNPANRRLWPEGKAFYGFDQVYDADDLDYRGPRFGFALMPDQFALREFQRRELARRDQAPVMAEIDMVSSHSPWAPLPRLVPWNRLGDGTVFRRIHRHAQSTDELWRNPANVQAAYTTSIVYSIDALVSFVQRYGDDDLVLVVLGDHQPHPIVSGHAASHDVPVTVIAHDSAVMDQISAWRWQDGMRPDPQAPVWRMDAFRNRFLAAYSPR